jgi:hypothetical protein
VHRSFLVTLLTHHFFQSCPWVFLPSFDRARPTAGRLIPVCLHFHPIQRSFAPQTSPSVIPRQVLQPVPRIRHPLSPPNWRRRSDMLDILIFNAGSLGDARSASARTINTFLFQVWGLVLEAPAYLRSSQLHPSSGLQFVVVRACNLLALRSCAGRRQTNRDCGTRKRGDKVEPSKESRLESNEGLPYEWKSVLKTSSRQLSLRVMFTLISFPTDLTSASSRLPFRLLNCEPVLLPHWSFRSLSLSTPFVTITILGFADSSLTCLGQRLWHRRRSKS